MGTMEEARLSDHGERIRVLWITNVSLPEGSELRGRIPTPFGGWLAGAAHSLAQRVELSVAAPGGRSADPSPTRGKRVTHYEFSMGANARVSRKDLLAIIEHVDPSIVHIFGTEYRHARQAAELCLSQGRPFAVSIQGLVSVYAKHYETGLPLRVRERFTLRDLARGDNVRLQRRGLRKRGIDEIETLRRATDIIGRTTWDAACTTQINPNATYHKCNESLRASFYEAQWTAGGCDPHTIFVSQGSYPVKGLHFMLEAMPIILEQFPAARLFVAGKDVTGGRSPAGRLRVSSYGKYIRDLIRSNGLADHVMFTGLLDERAMRAQYLRSNVFALTSTIENSPNSLGEAMLLGVPTVAAAVGGVTDMALSEVEALTYQSDATYMLAYQVCRIFNDDALAGALSAKARKRAMSTHNIGQNTDRLTTIYHAIINGASAS